MFTGLVEAMGTIAGVEDLQTTRRFRVACGDPVSELSPGDSVAVDGACLTVTAVEDGAFSVDVIGTTLERTIAGDYREGTVVNLERALRVGDRLGGHLVQGHVDGIGELLERTEDGEFWRLVVLLPEDVAAESVPRGSITLNGTSLTVAGLAEDGRCTIGLIPHTFRNTNLGSLPVGSRLNVEGDLIGKYVGKMLADRGWKR